MNTEQLNEEYFKHAKVLHITGDFPSISKNNQNKTFHNYGIGKVIVKRGSKGAIGSDRNNIYNIEAIKPRALVDTVG